MSKYNKKRKKMILQTEARSDGKYQFYCFAKFDGKTLIVFQDLDTHSNYAEVFDPTSEFARFSQ